MAFGAFLRITTISLTHQKRVLSCFEHEWECLLRRPGMLNLGNFREGSGRVLEHSGFRLRGCLFVLLLGVRKRCSDRVVHLELWILPWYVQRVALWFSLPLGLFSFWTALLILLCVSVYMCQRFSPLVEPRTDNQDRTEEELEGRNKNI